MQRWDYVRSPFLPSASTVEIISVILSSHQLQSWDYVRNTCLQNQLQPWDYVKILSSYQLKSLDYARNPCLQPAAKLRLNGQCHEIFCFRFFSWITFPQAPYNNIRIISNFFENLQRYSQVKVHHRCPTGVIDTWKWTWRQKFIYMFPLLPKGNQIKLLKFFWLKIFSICHRCRWHRWQTLSCEYLSEFSKKFETVLIEYSGAGGKLIHEKNQKQKISWHCPFKSGILSSY